MIKKADDDADAMKSANRTIANSKEEGSEKKNIVETVYEVEKHILALAKADEKNKAKWDELIALKIRKDKWVAEVQSVSVPIV